MSPNLNFLKMEEAKKIINILLDNLPDSIHNNDESWGWCWEELSSQAQDKVQEVRAIAVDFLNS